MLPILHPIANCHMNQLQHIRAYTYVMFITLANFHMEQEQHITSLLHSLHWLIAMPVNSNMLHPLHSAH